MHNLQVYTPLLVIILEGDFIIFHTYAGFFLIEVRIMIAGIVNLAIGPHPGQVCDVVLMICEYRTFVNGIE